MLANIKGLIVVLGLCIPLFAAARSTALAFMDAADFTRRRNIWLILTILAFISPSFWTFVAFAAPLLYWGGRKDTNPLAFYLFLVNVIPSIPIEIPTVWIKQLFDLDILRLLSLCVIVPAALQLRKTKDSRQIPGLKTMDLILLGLGALQVLFFVPPDTRNQVVFQNSLTNDLRTTFLFLIDIFALYYVASRSCQDHKKLLDALSAFCLSCCLMAIVAIFECAKHWLLYTYISYRWGGDAMLSEYFVRGSLLRAQASSGQPLALAFLLVLALGFWLYLRSHVKPSSAKFAVTALLCAGLLVTFSRGPWLAVVIMYFAFIALESRKTSQLFKAATVSLAICGILLASPLGTPLVHMIPFLGGQLGKSSLTYRELLLDRAWQLIKIHPIFGDQLALSHMQDLRQGQGIIDLVNTYLSTTLFYGFSGLSLFLAFQFRPLLQARRLRRTLQITDPDSARLGAALIAIIIGISILLLNSSLGAAPESLFYIVIGVACAYPAYHHQHRSPQAAITATGPPSNPSTSRPAALPEVH